MWFSNSHSVLSPTLQSSSRVGMPLHLQGSISTRVSMGWCWEYPMANTFSTIYPCQGSLPFQGTFTVYCTCPARAHRGKNNRGITLPTESFPRWTLASRVHPWGHYAVHCHMTALQPSLKYFLLEWWQLIHIWLSRDRLQYFVNNRCNFIFLCVFHVKWRLATVPLGHGIRVIITKHSVFQLAPVPCSTFHNTLVLPYLAS